MLLPPLVKEPPVTQRDVLRRIHTQPSRDAIDPLRGTLQLGKIPDRCLVYHAMPHAVTPFCAPFFIAKGSRQSQRKKNLLKRGAVGNFSLRLDAMLVPLRARGPIRQSLVRHHPSPAVVAYAQNLCPRTHLPVR